MAVVSAIHELLWWAEDASQLWKESRQANGRRWGGRATAVGTKWHLMAGNGGERGRKQEEATVALLSQRNIEDSARTAGHACIPAAVTRAWARFAGI
jgi:hypothetical protein